MQVQVQVQVQVQTGLGNAKEALTVSDGCADAHMRGCAMPPYRPPAAQELERNLARHATRQGHTDLSEQAAQSCRLAESQMAMQRGAGKAQARRTLAFLLHSEKRVE
jgi:hypothetical protein